MTALAFPRITNVRFCILVFIAALVTLLYPMPEAGAAPTNGASAIDVLGQFNSPSVDTTADYVKPCLNDGASSIGFNGPYGGALDPVNHLLFVADTSNNRVLVFTLSSSNVLSSKTPANVLGQADFVSCGTATTASGMNLPQGLAVDSTNQRLYVADYQNDRVLVFSTASITNGENASYVLGQADFTHGNANSSGTQSGLYGPWGLALDSTNSLLYVGDQLHSRVMVFSTASLANGENASYVLGQSLFTTNAAATTQSGMDAPAGVALDSTNSLLYVADELNQRVLVFSTSGITNGENASYVLGQSLFTTNTVATTQSGLYDPVGLAYDSTNQRLYVAEYRNNRVTVFSTAIISNGENASYVLGQSLFTTSTAATTQSGMNTPDGIIYDGTNSQVYVMDGTNNRVSLFSTSSITNGENASDLLGEYTSPSSPATVTYTQNGANNGPTALGFNEPSAVAVDEVNHYLYVADGKNNRVLVYALNTDNSIPTTSGGHTASYVLGQSGFGGNAAATTQSGMSAPDGLAVDSANQRLFVSDTTNNRVLVFSTSSLSNGMNASYVLGRSNFTVRGFGDTQSGMGSPVGLAYDSVNNLLYVADEVENRVTVYNVAIGTIANGENASYELGQPSGGTAFTTNTAATSQSGMSAPYGVALDSTDNLLFVSDYNNSRVLVFNVAPGTITNGENASYELGQPSGGSAFTTSGHATSQSRMFTPIGLSYDSTNSRLFVGDNENSRVLVFNLGPSVPNVISNGMNASNVLGAANFTTINVTTTQSTFIYSLGGLTYAPGSHHLFVTDGGTYTGGNNRVMIFEATYQPSGDYFNP